MLDRVNMNMSEGLKEMLRMLRVARNQKKRAYGRLRGAKSRRISKNGKRGSSRSTSAPEIGRLVTGEDGAEDIRTT